MSLQTAKVHNVRAYACCLYINHQARGRGRGATGSKDKTKPQTVLPFSIFLSDIGGQESAGRGARLAFARPERKWKQQI